MRSCDEDVIKSVQRVFEVFEWFGATGRPANAMTLSRSLGYPNSSTSSLLKSMSLLGYLAYDPIRRDYLPTSQLAQIGSWLDDGGYSATRLRRLTDELSVETGEDVTLSYQNDLDMVLIYQAGYVPESSTSKVQPLFGSAIGLSALSCRPDHEISVLIDRYNRRTYRPSAKIEQHLVLPKIRRARAIGHCVGADTALAEYSAIAWALPARGPAPPIVVAVAAPTERLRERESAIARIGRLAVKRLAD